MIETMKRALKYTMSQTENPAKMKEYMEEYLAAAGYDQRYKFKWRAISGNSEHTFSGIFEYARQKYYFNKMLGKIELKRI